MIIRSGPTRVATAVTAALCAAGLGLWPVAAQMEERDIFPFDFELDRAQLDTQRGANEVYGQLEREARDACRLRGGGLVASYVDDDCRADLVNKVVSRADSSTLSTRHRVALEY